MDASAYAFVHGIRSTRATLAAWNQRPWPVLRAWVAGSLAAATALLVAVWLIASIAPATGLVTLHCAPLQVVDPTDVARILARNWLVLALHAMHASRASSPAARCRSRPVIAAA